VHGYYLHTPANATASETTQTPGVDHLIWAHFYRAKRLCITRLQSSNPSAAKLLLEQARHEASKREYQKVYIWTEDDNAELRSVVEECGFKETEWFDQPMFRRFDQAVGDTEGNEAKSGLSWIGHQRWVNTTM
jgi:N-acetylglutamate synthase-like GNAT family acetyltransferase